MRPRTILVALALVVGMAAVPIAGLAATGDVLADQHENSTENADGNANVAPGERLSGVVGVQEAELEGEVDELTFGIRVAQAATNESRADVVADQLADIEQRLNETEQRKQALEQARANGSISEGKYRAEVAELAARTQTAKELTSESANASQGLPADLLESKGINVTAIQTLQERAEQLTGPEVAEIARSIAGNAAPVEAGPPEGVGGDGGPPESDGEDGEAGDDSGPGDAGPPEDGSGGDGAPGDTPSDGEDDAETPTPTPDEGDGDAGSADDGGDGGDGGGGY